MKTLELLLLVIGVLSIMTGCTGGGLVFLIPGMICVIVAMYIDVKQHPSP